MEVNNLPFMELLDHMEKRFGIMWRNTKTNQFVVICQHQTSKFYCLSLDGIEVVEFC